MRTDHWTAERVHLHVDNYQREREDCPCTLPTPRYTKQNARQIIRSSVANRFGHWCPTQTESLAFLCEQWHGEHAGRCVSTCVAHLRRNVDTMGRRNMKIFSQISASWLPGPKMASTSWHQGSQWPMMLSEADGGIELNRIGCRNYYPWCQALNHSGK